MSVTTCTNTHTRHTYIYDLTWRRIELEVIRRKPHRSLGDDENEGIEGEVEKKKYRTDKTRLLFSRQETKLAISSFFPVIHVLSFPSLFSLLIVLFFIFSLSVLHVSTISFLSSLMLIFLLL